MFGGPRDMMSQDTSKPEKVGHTLARLGSYFKPYTLVLLLVAGLIIAGAWSQVTTPQLIGQAVDCYLTPATVAHFSAQGGAGNFAIPGAPPSSASTPTSASTNCWFAKVDPKATTNDFINGLGTLVMAIIGLFVLGGTKSAAQPAG
jgi:ATP-binding cassette subfamily B multidrug efflux pump